MPYLGFMMKNFLAIGLLATLLLVGCGEPQESPEVIAAKAERAAELDAAVAAALAPDIPAGYKDTGRGLAVKWIKKETEPDEYSCKHYSACTNLKVFAYTDCPSSVYGKVNLKNSSGTVVDWTNDSLGSLKKGQYGILVFGTSGSGFTHSISELNCR